MAKFNIKEIEEVIGVSFNEPKLLKTALTHSSYANQHKDQEYNERFEFLGDAILQVSITEYLFLNYKEKSEGELTKIRSLIVCENSLYEIGKKLELGYFIRISRGEELTGGRERTSITADAVEALIAAIYLDKGLEFAKDFILGHFDKIIKRAINNDIVLDYKTKLQEELQKSGEVSIIYELLKYEGPPHRRKFFTSVLIEDRELGRGEGYSKKESEQDAAKAALEILEESNEQ
ncbi:ribonuclease III [Clostridium sp.]|uniref:ribonuclease III n=1 Tax=Clostridium sp. TaxID=1506 RepID=UPI002607E0F9|nr:ribonuclease III [Clostridium sp.]